MIFLRPNLGTNLLCQPGLTAPALGPHCEPDSSCYITDSLPPLEGGSATKAGHLSSNLFDRLKASPTGLQDFDQVDRVISKENFKPHDGDAIYYTLYQQQSPIDTSKNTPETLDLNRDAFKIWQALRSAIFAISEKTETGLIELDCPSRKDQQLLLRIGQDWPSKTHLRRYLHAPLKTRIDLIAELTKRCIFLGIELVIKTYPLTDVDIDIAAICYVAPWYTQALDTILKDLSRDMPDYFRTPLSPWNIRTGIKGVSSSLYYESPGVLKTLAIQYMLHETALSGRSWQDLDRATKQSLYTKWLMIFGMNPANLQQPFVKPRRHHNLTIKMGPGFMRTGYCNEPDELEQYYQQFLNRCAQKDINLDRLNTSDPSCILWDANGVFVRDHSITGKTRFVFKGSELCQTTLAAHQAQDKIVQTSHNRGQNVLGIVPNDPFDVIISVNKQTGVVRVINIYVDSQQKTYFSDYKTSKDICANELTPDKVQFFVFTTQQNTTPKFDKLRKAIPVEENKAVILTCDEDDYANIFVCPETGQVTIDVLGVDSKRPF